jgi:hypothetical protein
MTGAWRRRLRLLIALSVLLFPVVAGATAVAGANGAMAEPKQSWASFSSAWASGRWQDALVIAEQWEALLHAAMPLRIRSAVVVNHDHRALGVYEAAAGAIIQGKRLRVYVELDGVSSKDLGQGVRQMRVDVEGEFFAVDGSSVDRIGRMALGVHEVRTTDARPRLSFTTDVQLAPQTPPGKYRVVVHARSDEKTTSTPVDFVVPAAAP